MSDVNQFRAMRVPVALFGQSSITAAGAMPLFDLSAGLSAYNLVTISSGAVTANVYKTLLSVTGAGAVSYIGARTLNATAKVAGLRVTLDGVVVYNVQTSSFAQTNRILTALGYLMDVAASSNRFLALNPVAFNQSLLIEISSSLTETDQTQLGVSYQLFT